MIADNRERNLAVCQEIIDGRWSDWSDSGECKGSQKIEGVEGFRCGEGKKLGRKSLTTAMSSLPRLQTSKKTLHSDSGREILSD